jgi:hypothetical protein
MPGPRHLHRSADIGCLDMITHSRRSSTAGRCSEVHPIRDERWIRFREANCCSDDGVRLDG